jgi:Protein of unknown function (DUF1573)
MVKRGERMSDDFGTVNVKRGDRGREIELLRQHYRQHREALARMTAEAPTEHLAGEYQKLVRDIDASIHKLDEQEEHPPAMDDTERTTDPRMSSAASPRSAGDVLLATGAAAPTPAAPPAPMAAPRVALIIMAGVVVLGLIGLMIYRASSERRHPATAVEATAANETMATNPSSTGPSVAETPPAPVAVGAITVRPASADYGTIRKGTRAVRAFVVNNTTTAPIEIAVSRSACKCLFYEYRPTVPAKGKETVTVAVDGARAKSGPLSESVQVSSKKAPSVTASFQVTATIR